jgi:hypothetical protein
MILNLTLFATINTARSLGRWFCLPGPENDFSDRLDSLPYRTKFTRNNNSAR